MRHTPEQDLYLHYVAERHRIYEARRAGLPQPWTTDPILSIRKFTNDFRVLDHGSQFLLKMLQEPGIDAVDALTRAFLYRYTNRPAVWEYSYEVLGRYPLWRDVEDMSLASLWTDWRDAGGQVFSGAYIIIPAPGPSGRGVDKVGAAVALARTVVGAAAWDFTIAARTVEERYQALRRNKNIGDFMAMQITTDYGYSPFGKGTSEDEFVVAGPGARRGAAAIGMEPLAAIHWSREVLSSSPTAPALPLPSGSLRPLSLMDIQNTFCEFSKYVRFLERGVGSAPYRPEHAPHLPPPVLPDHWN